MKIRKKDINEAIARTPAYLDNVNIRAIPSVFLGYYTPEDANWSWELHAISVNDNPVVVASRFGSIVAETK